MLQHDHQLQCSRCSLNFDNEQRLCQILPCSCSICLACVHVLGQGQHPSTDSLEEFACSKCNQTHSRAILSENLETSQLVHSVLQSQSLPMGLKQHARNLSHTLAEQKSAMLKRHDTLVKEIDDAALRFIEVIKKTTKNNRKTALN